MKWLINGTDVTQEMDVDYCVHEQYADRRPDAITVRVAETSKWEKWKLKKGDSIRRKDGAADTGTMYISAIMPEAGFYRLRALSVKPEKRDQREKSWNGYRFSQAARQAAKSWGLKYVNQGCKDQIYKHIEQERESDPAFLKRLSILEGYGFVAYNGSLIVYDEREMESKKASAIVELDDEGEDFEIRDMGQLYGSCKVSAGAYAGTYKTKGTGGVYLPDHIKANSNGEALRFAKGLLRQENKWKKSGYIKFHEVMREYAAGSVLELNSKTHKSMEGKIFVSSVIHDYTEERTAIYFRYPLEEY